jgi:UDP-galactopyranose mutase
MFKHILKGLKSKLVKPVKIKKPNPDEAFNKYFESILEQNKSKNLSEQQINTLYKKNYEAFNLSYNKHQNKLKIDELHKSIKDLEDIAKKYADPNNNILDKNSKSEIDFLIKQILDKHNVK